MQTDPTPIALVATGDTAVDGEHEAIHTALMALCDGGPADAAALIRLERLVDGHFREEEARMGALAEDERVRHRHAHALFAARLRDCAETAAGCGTVEPGRIKDLALWFVIHSNTADHRLTEAIAAAETAAMAEDARLLLAQIRRAAGA